MIKNIPKKIIEIFTNKDKHWLKNGCGHYRVISMNTHGDFVYFLNMNTGRFSNWSLEHFVEKFSYLKEIKL